MEPYKKIDAQRIYYKKKKIKGKIVAVLDLALVDRNLALIVPQSRALKRGEIHEIIFTDEDKGPGDVVEKVSYIGFFEVEEGGIAIKGDVLTIKGTAIAKLIGFNDTHMPNHQNIVFYSPRVSTGKELGIDIGDEVEIEGRRKDEIA